MTEHLTCLNQKLINRVSLYLFSNKLDEYMFFYNKHLDLQFSDFILKVLNRLLRLLVISKDIKNKTSKEIFISLSLPIPGKKHIQCYLDLPGPTLHRNIF